MKIEQNNFKNELSRQNSFEQLSRFKNLQKSYQYETIKHEAAAQETARTKKTN